jgi:hypothetical protein
MIAEEAASIIGRMSKRKRVLVAVAPGEMRVLALLAGSMSSRAAFAFRGGAFGEERVFSTGGVLVQHHQRRT